MNPFLCLRSDRISCLSSSWDEHWNTWLVCVKPSVFSHCFISLIWWVKTLLSCDWTRCLREWNDPSVYSFECPVESFSSSAEVVGGLLEGIHEEEALCSEKTKLCLANDWGVIHCTLLYCPFFLWVSFPTSFTTRQAHGENEIGDMSEHNRPEEGSGRDWIWCSSHVLYCSLLFMDCSKMFFFRWIWSKKLVSKRERRADWNPCLRSDLC